MACDFVVAGIGIEPEVPTFAGQSVAQSNGVLVDELCRASAPDVYAAGDVANHLHPVFGRVRVEHYNNAETAWGARRRGRCSARPLHTTTSTASGPTSTSTSSSTSATPRNGTSSSSAGAWRSARLVGFYLLEGQVRAAVGLDRGGDPELDTRLGDGGMRAPRGRSRSTRSGRLADERVDLWSLGAECRSDRPVAR